MANLEVCLRKMTDRPTYYIQTQGYYFLDKMTTIGTTNNILKALYIYIRTLRRLKNG